MSSSGGMPNINKVPDFAFKVLEEMPLNLEIKNSSYSTYKTLVYQDI